MCQASLGSCPAKRKNSLRYADANGLLSWAFITSCITNVGTAGVVVKDGITGKESNVVTETVTRGACPTIAVSPTSFHFGTVNVGSSAQKTFTISNPGTANLLISDISTQNPPFATNLSSGIASIAPNTQATFDVIFSPAGAVPYSGDVTITSNASTLPTSVSLTGAGSNSPPPPANQGGGPAGGSIRALAMAPSNPSTIYAGADVLFDALAQTFEQKRSGSVFKTTNGGQSWIAVSNGLPDAPVQSLAVDPNNPDTAYAAIHANGIFKTVDGGQNWVSVNTGLTDLFAFVIAIDPRNSSTVYAGNQNVGGLFKSTNGGQSWVSVNLGFTFSSVTSFAFDHINPSTMYVGTSIDAVNAGFFKTTDGGQSWTLTGAGLNEPPLGRAVSVSAIAIDPINPDILYVAGGSVFKSADGGQSWTLVALRLGVSSILVDPSQPATLYAAGISGFFKSTDAGASWVAMNLGLTDTEVQALTMNPAAPSTLYLATTNDGVFKTADGGQLWASATAGITARVVGALAVDPAS
jgi:photosystem II stability/assembly factor-like uncharacterized protein